MFGGELVACAVVRVVALLVACYDVLTLALYALLQRPWSRLWRAKRTRACPVNGDVSHYKNCDPPSEMYTLMQKHKLFTVDQVLRYAVNEYGDSPCCGVREVLSESSEVQHNGKVFTKYLLGEYQWISYSQFERRAVCVGRALGQMGVASGDRVAIYAETCCEWLVAAVGMFINNITVVTLYATLNEQEVVFALNHTQVALVITSHQLADKMASVLTQCPSITTVVCIGRQTSPNDVTCLTSLIGASHVRVLSFAETLQRGEHLDDEEFSTSSPQEHDIAIIMFTSGSTGQPKGVMISHGNMVCTMNGFATATNIRPRQDVYLAYLPLAHVLELLAEMCCMMMGVTIGYGSPMTLIDTSRQLQPGCRGDCAQLRPTLMAAVPAVLDRISQGIQERAASYGRLAHLLLLWAVSYRTWWRRWGFDTPILHRLVFSRVAALLGGRVRGMASGGAPLSDATHELVRSCMGVSLLQGYGLTESTGSATIMHEDDLAVGTVGAALTGVHIKLIDWHDGNYLVTDKPNPRGEILVGGGCVAMGYYKPTDDISNEDFFEKDGQRWFRTGDIGEIQPNGTLKIIDRRKQLLKLQCGEYVSPARVEAVLISSCPLIDQLLVSGRSSSAQLVAIAVPNIQQLRRCLSNWTAADGDVHEQAVLLQHMCDSHNTLQLVLQQLQQQARLGGLSKWEVPARLYLSSVSWTPDNSLVTAALKPRRRALEQFYQPQLQQMFDSL